MTGLGRFPENNPKMAKFGFSANNFGTEGPRDLKFGLLASPGVGLPRTRIKKNRVSVLLLPVVSLVVLKSKHEIEAIPSVVISFSSSQS